MVSESIDAVGSPKLEVIFDLVVQLYFMRMRFKFYVCIIHVTGTRMIVQGTDGISRSDMYE